MENGARRRGNKGVKQKRGGKRCTPKRKAGNKNERVRTRLTWKRGREGGNEYGCRENKRGNSGAG